MPHQTHQKRDFLVTLAIACALTAVSYQLGKRAAMRSNPPQNTVENAGEKIPKTGESAYAKLVSAAQSRATLDTGNPNKFASSTDPTNLISEESRQWISDFTKSESLAFSPFLKQLGLSDEDLAKVIARKESVHLRSRVAQNATAELSHERVLYDAALRKALTPEAYEKYVHFEKSRPASHEVEEMVKFAGPAGSDIGPFAQVLEDAIFETGATLTTPTHGPYDPDPNPTADPDKGMEILLGRIDRLRTSSNSLLTQISDSLPSEIVSRIRNYYEVQINELTSHISFIEKNAQFARMTDEEMTAKLRSDPAFLRSFISNP